MKTITIEDFEKNMEYYTTKARAFLPTAWGNKEVTGLNSMFGYPSAYCGKDNGGFGISYAVHYGTTLIVEER